MKSKSKRSLEFDSTGELVEYFDRNDLGDYLKEQPRANFKVNLKQRSYWFCLKPELAGKLIKFAMSRKVSSEKLLNAWVREKIRKAS